MVGGRMVMMRVMRIWDYEKAGCGLEGYQMQLRGFALTWALKEDEANITKRGTAWRRHNRPLRTSWRVYVDVDTS